jgi:hypothetical protein
VTSNNKKKYEEQEDEEKKKKKLRVPVGGLITKPYSSEVPL